MTASAWSEYEKLEAPTVEAFRASLRGQLIWSQDHDYDTVRKVYNAMIDRRPALIARGAGVADVIRSVNFAREAGIAWPC